jgi:hypothetical protein
LWDYTRRKQSLDELHYNWKFHAMCTVGLTNWSGVDAARLGSFVSASSIGGQKKYIKLQKVAELQATMTKTLLCSVKKHLLFRNVPPGSFFAWGHSAVKHRIVPSRGDQPRWIRTNTFDQ